MLSAVNLAEVLSKLADRGVDAVALRQHLSAAELRRIDTGRVLGLADRCCLAFARRLSAAVVTADCAWSGLETGVEVQQVR